MVAIPAVWGVWGVVSFLEGARVAVVGGAVLVVRRRRPGALHRPIQAATTSVVSHVKVVHHPTKNEG